jgi:hypothetical protein
MAAAPQWLAPACRGPRGGRLERAAVKHEVDARVDQHRPIKINSPRYS